MFTMTPTAAQRVRQAAEESGATHMALRVAARQEADGSIHYGMGFDDPQAGETPALQMDGVTILIAPTSRTLLAGTVLDFVELEPGDFNFIFIPPDAAPAGDGCGPSVATGEGGCGSGACGSGACASGRSAN
jgi:iron-sulfur cluster assembly protein